jgi:hypothetical protein
MKFALIFSLATAAVLTAAGKPSILLLLISEDRGYADIFVHGRKQAVTSHLDKLTMSGTRRTNHCTIEKRHNHEP